MPIKSTKFLKFSKTHYMPIKEDFNTKTSTNPQNFRLRRSRNWYFWRLTIYYYFAIIETLFFITLRRYCSSGRCFQVRICQFRSHYMPIKKQNFRKFSETHYMPITLYAHKGLYFRRFFMKISWFFQKSPWFFLQPARIKRKIPLI